jgi:hypothetical protein|tara:strand:- start:432 stop:692 length:261 start_codon:yes stop_codon:yes gene_type:complete
MIKWIDVQDELPEPGVTVFVTGVGFFNSYEASVQRWERAIDPNHKDDEPHWFATREMEPYDGFVITHWHPFLKEPTRSKTIKIESK